MAKKKSKKEPIVKAKSKSNPPAGGCPQGQKWDGTKCVDNVG